MIFYILNNIVLCHFKVSNNSVDWRHRWIMTKHCYEESTVSHLQQYFAACQFRRKTKLLAGETAGFGETYLWRVNGNNSFWLRCFTKHVFHKTRVSQLSLVRFHGVAFCETKKPSAVVYLTHFHTFNYILCFPR